MYCVHCGKQIKDDALICPGCGMPTVKFNEMQQAKKATLAEQIQQEPMEQRQGKKFPLSMSLSFSAFVIMCLGSVLATIVTTALTQQLLNDSYYDYTYVTPNSIATAPVIVAGIFSIIALVIAVSGFAFMFIEKVKKPCRVIFPAGMFVLSLCYFINFICSAVTLNF